MTKLRKPMKHAITASVAIALLAAIACASFTTDAYKTLSVTEAAVDTAMQAYGSAYRAGQLTPAQNANIVAAYAKYQSAASAAVQAVQAYGSLSVKAPVTTAVNQFSAAAADLLTLVKEFQNGSSNPPAK